MAVPKDFHLLDPTLKSVRFNVFPYWCCNHSGCGTVWRQKPIGAQFNGGYNVRPVKCPCCSSSDIQFVPKREF